VDAAVSSALDNARTTCSWPTSSAKRLGRHLRARTRYDITAPVGDRHCANPRPLRPAELERTRPSGYSARPRKPPSGSRASSGAMSERLKEHAWKVCIRLNRRIEGSNPSRSASWYRCGQNRPYRVPYELRSGDVRRSGEPSLLVIASSCGRRGPVRDPGSRSHTRPRSGAAALRSRRFRTR
jgi:hypothetical protein